MASINKVILIGNLGRDPEMRYTADSNTAICSITLATSRRYKDSQGQLQEETEWHRVVMFGRQAEVAAQYLHKGSSVYIEGRLRTRKYTGKDGIERYATDIISETMQFLGGRPNGGTSSSQSSEEGGFESAPRRASVQHAPAATPAAAPAQSAGDINEDDVPF